MWKKWYWPVLKCCCFCSLQFYFKISWTKVSFYPKIPNLNNNIHLEVPVHHRPWIENNLRTVKRHLVLLSANKELQNKKFWAIRGKKDDADTVSKSEEENIHQKENKRSRSYRASQLEKIRNRLRNLFSSDRRKGLKQNIAYNNMLINSKNNIKPNGLFGISKRYFTDWETEKSNHGNGFPLKYFPDFCPNPSYNRTQLFSKLCN